MKTCGAGVSSSLARSITSMRSGSPIWMAARPMPGASYMVVQHVVGQFAQGASTRSTGLETWRRMGSGRMMSGLIGMASHLRRRSEKRQPGRVQARSRFDLCRRARIGYAVGMNDLTTILSEPVARLGATTITLGHALAFGAIAVLGLFLALVIALWRSARARAVAAAEAADHARDAEARMAGILQGPGRDAGPHGRHRRSVRRAAGRTRRSRSASASTP